MPQTYSIHDLMLSRASGANAYGGGGKDGGFINLSSYQILISDPHSGQGYDVTPLCTSLQWDYDLDQASEKYTLTLVKVSGIVTLIKPLNQLIIKAILLDAANGISSDMQNLKFGIVIDTSLEDTARGTVTITAYDIMWYLTANKASHILQPHETATHFINRTAALYGIPLGTVEDTVVELGGESGDVWLEQTIWNMWVTALSLTRDVAYSNKILDAGSDPSTEDPVAPEDKGSRYYLRTTFDKVNLLRKKDPLMAWKFETGNIFSASSAWTASNYRNVVRVYKRQSFDQSSTDVADNIDITDDGDPLAYGQYPKDPVNDPQVKKYGMLSEAVSLAGASDPSLMEPDNPAQADYQARELWVRLSRILQTSTISTININTLGPGDPVYISEPITGMNSKFYVKSGSHKVSAQGAIMTLTLNVLDMLPEAYKNQAESTTPLFGGVA